MFAPVAVPLIFARVNCVRAWLGQWWLKLPRKLRVGLHAFAYLLTALVSPFVAYALIAFSLGSLSLNRDRVDPEEGVEIFLHTGGVHTDFVLPRMNRAMNWGSWFPKDHFEAYEGGSHVFIGWGDRAVYTEVPYWSNLTFGIAFRAALLKTPTLNRIGYTDKLRETNFVHRLVLSQSEYKTLVDYIKSSFRLDAQGKPVLVPDVSFVGWDAYYEATGSYHLVNTCNEWVAAGLRKIRQPAPVWAPFSSQIQQLYNERSGRGSGVP